MMTPLKGPSTFGQCRPHGAASVVEYTGRIRPPGPTIQVYHSEIYSAWPYFRRAWQHKGIIFSVHYLLPVRKQLRSIYCICNVSSVLLIGAAMFMSPLLSFYYTEGSANTSRPVWVTTLSFMYCNCIYILMTLQIAGLGQYSKASG